MTAPNIRNPPRTRTEPNHMDHLSLILSIVALVAAFVALDRTRRAMSAQPPAQPQPAPRPAAAALATSAPAADTGLPAAPEILAAIAAAVSIVCGPNARIADVQPAASSSNEGNGTAHPWALEGRRALHATHSPR